MVEVKKIVTNTDSRDLQERFLEEIKEDFINTVKHVPDILSLDAVNENETMEFSLDFNKTTKKFGNFLKYWAYLQLNHSQKSANTIYTSFSHVVTFCNFIGDNFNSKGFEFLTEYQYKGYLTHLIERVKSKDMSPSTANSYANSVCNFLKNLNTHNILKCDFVGKYNISKYVPRHNPERYFKGKALEEYIKEQQKNSEKFLTYEELELIFKNIDLMYNPVYRTGIEILVATGLRATELVHLDIDCAEIEVHDGNNIYWLSKYKVIKKKRGAWEQGSPLRISKELFDAIQKLISTTSRYRKKASQKNKNKLFLNEKSNVLPVDRIRKSFNNLAKKIGIGKTGLHLFRHTYGKILADKKVPIEYIKKYLNHQEVHTTGGYIDHTKEEKLKKYKDFISIEKFEGGAKDKAEVLQGRLGEIFENKEFQGMVAESQIELLQMVTGDSGADVNVMNHGICFLPNLTQCPNNYTDINSCIDEHCEDFASTEHSINFLEMIARDRSKSSENLKKAGYINASERTKEQALKTKKMLDQLKKDS